MVDVEPDPRQGERQSIIVPHHRGLHAPAVEMAEATD